MNRFARVVKVHPEANSVDLLFLDDMSRVPLVKVLAPSASTNTGLSDMAQPTSAGNADPYDPKPTKDRDIYAIVAYAQNTPFVLGFLFPEVCQMLFADVNRRVERHASDLYSTVDGDANYEFYHPSGTYFRVAEDPSHEDLTGQDFDQKWAIAKNTNRQVHIHFELWAGGAKKVSFDADPGGNITGTNTGTLNWTSTGNVTLTCPAHVKVDCPDTLFTGNVTVQGLITGQNQANITGTVTVTTGDVIADGIHLKTHEHSGVQTGSGTSGPPV